MGKTIILSMMYANRIAEKSYFLCKQNWSLPTITIVILCLMMLLIHSFESFGILNGNKNLEYRIKSGENAILTYKINIHNTPIIQKTEKNDNEMLVSDKIKKISEKNREENLEKQRNMIMESALEQDILEDVLISIADNRGYTTNNQEEKANFFDL